MSRWRMVIIRVESNDVNVVRMMRYMECRRNHALHIGGQSVDGCQEFLGGAGPEGSEAALTCAACGCHRNFHRAEEVTTDASGETVS
ncbi:hypothetical protein ACS0TY_034582 [Phlomoides rotata]